VTADETPAVIKLGACRYSARCTVRACCAKATVIARAVDARRSADTAIRALRAARRPVRRARAPSPSNMQWQTLADAGRQGQVGRAIVRAVTD
jgi:hypothetical protein